MIYKALMLPVGLSLAHVSLIVFLLAIAALVFTLWLSSKEYDGPDAPWEQPWIEPDETEFEA